MALAILFTVNRPMWGVPELKLPEPLELLERRVVERTLANGFHVLILPRHVSPTVSLNILFRVGAIDEPSGQSGLAHLLEHMMFKGTTTLGPDELWEVYTRHGADSLNAGTGLDLTSYVVRLPANTLELWAIVDADRLRHPVFRDFYKERDVVKEERRLRIESDPEGQLWETFLTTAFTVHPYRRPTIGWMADVERLTPEDVENFFRTQYLPRRAAIVVVGEVDPQGGLALINRYFGRIPAGPPTAPPPILERMTPEPPQHGTRRIEVEWDAEPRLIVGYHKPAWPHPDDAVCEVIEQILARGRTSRFYRGLVERRRLATSVSAYNATPGSRADNLFVIEGTPRHPHSVQVLETAVEAELQQLQRTLVSDPELAKVKHQLAADFIRALQSDSGMAWQLAQAQAITGDWRMLFKRHRAIQAVMASDVQRVARSYFVPRNKTVAILVKPRG